MSPRQKSHTKTEEHLAGAASQEKPKQRAGARLPRPILATAAVILILLAGATFYAFWYGNKFLPHTRVSGVQVGGLTYKAATALLDARATSFEEQELTLSYLNDSWQVKPADLGTTVSATNALTTLWNQQKGGDWLSQLTMLFSAPFASASASASIIATNEAGNAYLQTNILSAVEKPFKETTLALSTREVKVVPGEAGERLNRIAFEDALRDAFSNGNRRIALLLEPSSPEVTPAMAEPARARVTELLKSDLTITAQSREIIVDTTSLVSWFRVAPSRDSGGVATGLAVTLDDGVLKTALDTWAAQVDKAPRNAKLAVGASGSLEVVSPPVDGIALDKTATAKALADWAASGTGGKVTAVVGTSQAEVRADTLAALGLKELVGTARTDFAGSPNNRKFNIKKGADALDRQLVKPGAVFSTTGTLGPVEESTGYLPELVIKGNRTTPEAGGGLCQVSTTLFRSVLNAGMPILERQNHAYRVSYYEREVGPGLDATVYIPNPDLKWKNDFGAAVFVQSHIEGTKITFDLYGSKDGRVSTIGKPQILETYPVGDPVYVETDSLLKGETRQIEHAHDGAKTSVSYKVSRDGKEIYSKTFISIYRAWPAQYLVGTKEPDPAA